VRSQVRILSDVTESSIFPSVAQLVRAPPLAHYEKNSSEGNQMLKMYKKSSQQKNREVKQKTASVTILFEGVTYISSPDQHWLFSFYLRFNKKNVCLTK